MAAHDEHELDETAPLARNVDGGHDDDSVRRDSTSSISTTSVILEHLSDEAYHGRSNGYTDGHANGTKEDKMEEFDEELGGTWMPPKPVDKKARRLLWIIGLLCLAGWLLAAAMFVVQGSYKHASSKPHDPAATASRGSGKQITLDQVQGGEWRARKHSIQWIAHPDGADGLLLERGEPGKNYLVVGDVRYRKKTQSTKEKKTLMVSGAFYIGDTLIIPTETWPSPDLRRVLVVSDRQSNWRHSFTGRYWIFDVATQTAEPLDPANPNARVQLATWSPTSDIIMFTRDNNLFLRHLNNPEVFQITNDGGPEVFYGVPDWVYEEEVFSGRVATWWSQDGKYVAFLRTNETMVPTFPLQYWVSRPTGKQPEPGLENYPDVKDIKYPKAGAPNPIVNLEFFDVDKGQRFNLPIENDFADDDRLITEVVWAGTENKVIVRETNRESDVLKVVIMDVGRKQGRTVREQDVQALDGGWFEVSQETKFIPSDPGNGRPHAGYIDTIIHNGYDHLAYFTPLENPEPILLSSGEWEVVKAPSAVDLKNNWVYFDATKESSIQRHVYRVNLNGTGLKPITDTSKEGWYSASFSEGSGYALLSYDGPGVPWQKVISTEGANSSYTDTIEENRDLQQFASRHELPLMIYSTINVDGFDLNVLERRPPHFNPKKKYPVLFYMYQGPGSQTVSKQWNIDFQAFVAANLGYIVVTVDGRGTGFLGRKLRCITRGNIGAWEAHDQIAAAKMWAKKKYVDEERMAIWGWSYGGFMTLKTLELDAGQTFKYGMAVAPVTDWRYYDSIYTERYMHTPQHNPAGYDNTSIHDVHSLGQNVRFLVMHGVADDNVHTQSTYTLLDKLDLGGVENYDVHVFPDSDHGIYFHNANRIVYDKLTNWLVNAFNGEWLRTANPVPKVALDAKRRRDLALVA